MKMTRMGILVGVVTAAVCFAAGIGYHKYKFFPYPQISRLLKGSKSFMPRHENTGATAPAGSHYTRDPGAVDLRKDIDTGLLPLKATGIRLSEHFEFPKFAGGITIINDAVIIVDWLGGVYAYEGGKVRKLTFPELPTYSKEFLLKPGASLNPNSLRVQDVEYIPALKALAVSHEQFDTKLKTTRLVVSTISINERTFEPSGTWQTLFRGDPLKVEAYAGLAGGGRMTLKAPDKLLLTAGDYNQDDVMMSSARVAQDTNSTFGKVLEIDLPSKRHRMVSYGHRNPQGLVVAASGDIFSTEHGPAGGDELNHIIEGANYGWPNVTLGTDYGTYDWPHSKLAGDHRGYALPAYAWIPSIGVGNVIQLKGFHPRWEGDLLVASLKALTLYRLRMDGARVVYSEAIWIGDRIRDLAQLRDGTIVLWTDDAKLLFLSVDEEKLKLNKRAIEFYSPVMSMCMNCHHFGPTNPTHLAPSLSGLNGKKVASDNFPRYSVGLIAAGGIWSKERLKLFIANPLKFAPGSAMPSMEISEADIDRIVQILESAK